MCEWRPWPRKGSSALVLYKFYGLHSSCHDLIMSHFDGVRYLNVGSGNENMHHAHIGIKTSLSILFYDSRQPADLGTKARACDLSDAFKFAL